MEMDEDICIELHCENPEVHAVWAPINHSNTLWQTLTQHTQKGHTHTRAPQTMQR